MADTPASPPRRFFAEFGVRMVAFWFDLFLVAFASQVLKDYALAPAGLSFQGVGPLIPVVGFLYFTLCWLSPLRASLFQWLLGMRVVDKQGDGLRPVRAAVRAAALLALFFAAFAVLGELADALYIGLAIAALVALYLAAVTLHRQAAHDLLAGSVVVNKRALRAFDAFGSQPPPSIWKKLSDALLFAVPVIFLLFVADMHRQRDLVYRTSYAVDQTARLKVAISEFYEYEQRWPEHEAELGAVARGDYPDGGFYELDANGVIRISFEVKPELVRGQIIISPVAGEEGVSWGCHQEGDIRQHHLPAGCRDRGER